MLRLVTSAALGLVLNFSFSFFGPEFASLCAHAQGPVEKTVPQGEDPPGVDDEQPAGPLIERNGVITPPPIGDEEIYTDDVPNPEAGHDEEVIPPPGTPGADPNVEPR